MLTFSKGNAKLGKQTLIFNLPAGRTCPGALYCKSFAVVDANGKRSIQDGNETIFRCFAASSEVQYDGAFRSRLENLNTISEYLQNGVEFAASQLNVALQHYRTRNTELIRIHESGDFYSIDYLRSWIRVAEMNPDLKFYCYSKSLLIFLDVKLPENFYMTASYGGKWDYLIDEGFFTRYSKVVMNEEEAESKGLEVDHDDSHCFGDKPFALLVHGTQPKGSATGAAIRQRRKNNQFSGYNKKNTLQPVG